MGIETATLRRILRPAITLVKYGGNKDNEWRLVAKFDNTGFYTAPIITARAQPVMRVTKETAFLTAIF